MRLEQIESGKSYATKSGSVLIAVTEGASYMQAAEFIVESNVGDDWTDGAKIVLTRAEIHGLKEI